MTKRVRDYAAEYQRRLNRAREFGYDKATARGHAKKGRAGIKLAKVLGIEPGQRISRRPPQPPAQPGFPTFEQRLTEAGFRDFLKDARAEYLRRLKRQRKFPKGEAPSNDDIEYLVTSKEDFVQAVYEAEQSERDAYTAWFSPR